MADSSDTISAVHSLKQRIDDLSEQQLEAITQATYLGMTTDEAKEYENRRKMITKLVRELAAVTGAL